MQTLNVDQLRQAWFGQNVIRRHHGDNTPRTNLSTVLAADTDRQIDGADTHGIAGVNRVGNLVDTVHRANGHAGVTARADILIENSELLGKLLLLGHTTDSA